MSTRASYRALRAFLEVARQGSVVAAARALGITPSAVSHLLRELETGLGIALFQPGPRRVALTEAGERLRQGLGEGFDAIDRAVAELTPRGGEIRVSTLSTFATLWLVPRLPRMRAVLPGLHVRVATDTRPVDLAAEPFDCAIRWGRGDWPGLVVVPLLHEQLVAVAAPALVPGDGAGLAAVLALPRVAAGSRPEDWPLLLGAIGCPADAHVPHLVFQTRALAVRAAIAGLGVAVVDRALVQDALDAGHLVRVVPALVDRPEAHFFVARPEALRDKGLRSFRDWLVSEASGLAR